MECRQLERFNLSGLEETGKELGRGSYGEVVEMKLPDGRIVAGKKIHSTFFAEGNASGQEKPTKEKFEQECERMSKLCHENLVMFFGVHYKPDSDLPILVMELVPMSLTNYLENEEKIPNHIKNSILFDVSEGLQYLHTRRPPIIHRDLTANNVLLTSEKRAKIADFGMSCYFKVESEKDYMKQTTCPGTHVYMPPESLRSDYKATHEHFDKLDVFSFGVLILHVYTQEWPQPTVAFDENNTPKTEVQRRQHLLDKVDSGIFKKLAIQCLNNQPQSRPHMLEIRQKIDQLVSSTDKTLKRQTQYYYEEEECPREKHVTICDEDFEIIWLDADLFQDYTKIKKSINKSAGSNKRKHILEDVTKRLASDEHPQALMEEINNLSHNKRSVLVYVHNRTSYTIETSRFVIFGEQKQLNVNTISPNSKRGYNYEKSTLSLKGCAGIQTFAVKLSETSELCFLIAFRNYTIQVRRRSRNKVALLFLKDRNITADVCYFESIMKNVESNPDLPGCYPSDQYDCTFKTTIASEKPTLQMEFENIVIRISMTPYYDSEVKVIISTKTAIEGTSYEIPNGVGMVRNIHKDAEEKETRDCHIM